jgi:UDP-N-acetylglucosamine 2-epimerase (non-hydrolysing)
MKKIFVLIGTRPNFIKVTQFKSLAKNYPNLSVSIIHTGQHYDKNMADVFFNEFNLVPDFYLNIKPSSPSNQIAEIILKLDDLFAEVGKPDLLIVPGDVNSTLAGAIYANKNNIKLAHLEAGLRSFDNTMPEEHNRILTDNISDILFVTEQSGLTNLEEEKCDGKIHFVGNTMIDTLVQFESQINKSTILERLAVNRKYIVTTIHRPGNVDTKEGLQKLAKLFSELSKDYDILFPVHPRTLSRIKEFGLEEEFKQFKGLQFLEPLGYFDFQKLVKHCSFVLTDSGGIQEETTYRQIPCLTLRQNTERPITCKIGSNTLVPFDIKILLEYVQKIKHGNYKKGAIPPLWDGKSTERILEIIGNNL